MLSSFNSTYYRFSFGCICARSVIFLAHKFCKSVSFGLRSSSESGGVVDVGVVNLIGVKEELFSDFVVEVLAS